MSEVKRYDCETESMGEYRGDFGVMRESDEGDYVLHSDYAALNASHDRLKAVVEAFENYRELKNVPPHQALDAEDIDAGLSYAFHATKYPRQSKGAGLWVIKSLKRKKEEYEMYRMQKRRMQYKT